MRNTPHEILFLFFHTWKISPTTSFLLLNDKYSSRDTPHEICLIIFSGKNNTPHEIFLFIFEFSACWCLIDRGPEKYHFERSRESHGMVPWWHGMVPWPWYGTVVPWCGIMVPWTNTMKPWCHETTILPACRNVFFTWFKHTSNRRRGGRANFYFFCTYRESILVSTIA